MITSLRIICSLTAMFLLAACVSPNEHLYILESYGEHLPSHWAGYGTVVIGPISVPVVDDRPQLVIQEDGYDADVKEQHRWASPLKQSLPRLLAEQLTTRLNYRFVAESSSAIAVPTAHLAIDYSKLDLRRSTGVAMTVHWVFTREQANVHPIEGDFAVEIPSTADGYVGLIGALRQANSALANSIADRLKDALVQG